MATHLMAGGKRLRPALVLLCGGLFNADQPAMIPVAAACELIHMATLVHDDIIDASGVRRGVPAVHAKWGVPASVLIGDHLFARGFSLLAAQGDPAVVGLMSEVVARTCAGEIDELQTQWDVGTTEEAYFRRVYAKTGHFIAACCQMGALLGHAPAQAMEAVVAYGTEIGTCFQVVDDLLDLTASAEVLGKPTGSDLRMGVFTLPVLRALAGPYGAELRELLQRRAIDDDGVEAVRALLVRSGALEYAARRALTMARRAQEALLALPPGPYRDVLHALAQELALRIH